MHCMNGFSPKKERNKRGYRSNARSTHKKLQMKIVNLKNEKRKCSISTLCEYDMAGMNIIDQKKKIHGGYIR